MYGLNAVAFVFFVGLNLTAHWLSKASKEIYQRMILVLCLSLLLGNLVLYAFVYPILQGEVRIPVEFSAVAYFVVPVLLLKAGSATKSWAAYAGLMAGFFYYMAMIVAGGPLYHHLMPHEVYLSLYFHGALYICGLVTISRSQCAQVSSWQLFTGVAYVGLRALLLRPVVQGAEKLFIYILLDGIFIKSLFASGVWGIISPLYYGLLGSLLFLSFKGFRKLSSLRYRKFSF